MRFLLKSGRLKTGFNIELKKLRFFEADLKNSRIEGLFDKRVDVMDRDLENDLRVRLVSYLRQCLTEIIIKFLIRGTTT